MLRRTLLPAAAAAAGTLIAAPASAQTSESDQNLSRILRTKKLRMISIVTTSESMRKNKLV